MGALRRRRQAGGAADTADEGRGPGGTAPTPRFGRRRFRRDDASGSVSEPGSAAGGGAGRGAGQAGRQAGCDGGLTDAAIAASRPRATAVEYGISLLAARAWPEKKLREKIRARYSEDDTEAGLERLRELRLVDDAAWAERYARDRFERLGKGRHRIRVELIGKGIDAPTADAALDRVVGGEDERAKAAAMLEQMRSRLTRGPGRPGPRNASRGGTQESPLVGQDGPEGDPEVNAQPAPTADPRERRAAAERLKNRLFRRMLARGFPASVVRDLLDVS